MIKISYFITIKNELAEIKKLLPFIQEHKKIDDEIVILMDNPYDIEVENYLKIQDIQLITHSLNNNFSQFKNYGTSKCKNDYIFNLDTDEFPPQYLLKNIHLILEQNDIECVWLPRINIVKGMTFKMAPQFGFQLNEKGWINFPDPQQRIYKNDFPRIHWEKPVHERLVGYKTHSILPFDMETIEHLAIKHIKSLDTQINQNQKYAKIMKQNNNKMV